MTVRHVAQCGEGLLGRLKIQLPTNHTYLPTSVFLSLSAVAKPLAALGISLSLKCKISFARTLAVLLRLIPSPFSADSLQGAGYGNSEINDTRQDLKNLQNLLRIPT